MLLLNSLVLRLHALKSERGATAVEYGVMVALIAAFITVAVALVGTNLNTLFNTVAGKIAGTTP